MDTRLDVSRLESLLESAKMLNSSLELDDLLRHLLRTAMGRLLVTRAALALESHGRFYLEIARGLPALQKGQPIDIDVAHAAGLQYFFPIGDPAHPVGAFAFNKPAQTLDAAEQEFLEALLGLAATGIANARAHKEVLRTNQELRALLDLGRGLAATTDPDEVAQMLTLTLAGRWAVRKQGVFTWKPGQPAIERVKGLDNLTLDAVRRHVEEGAPLDVPAGSIVFPILSGDKPMGAVVCGPRHGNREYSEADREFGGGLVSAASVALDNAWHFRETLIKQQMEKELSLAAGIQKDLFPKQLPALYGCELAARNRQARQVGGDYYDAIPFGAASESQPHLLCVADISGKGLSAALLMSTIQATLRALLTGREPLATVAARTNDLLYASTPSSKYATAFFCLYHTSSGSTEYVNCGHNDGIILRAGGAVDLLPTTGMPVGLFPKRSFESASTNIGPGDMLFLYSDGVTEACTDVEENQYGLDRLVDCLQGCAADPAPAILDRVFDSIDEFAAGAPQHDDITMLVLKRTA
jgi:phosphoserine phosphatase RsbU/P